MCENISSFLQNKAEVLFLIFAGGVCKIRGEEAGRKMHSWF
jgi:hypothetical protein